MTEPYRGLLIADFTADMLAGYINNDTASPAIIITVAPYDQVTQILVDGDQACWNELADFAIVWTRPESTVPAFARLLASEEVSPDELTNQVDQFVAQVKSAATRVRFMLVPIWTAPLANRGLGLLDLTHPQGIAGNLMRMNQRLIVKLAETDKVYPLDTQRWQAAVGADTTSPKLWYMAKSLFGNRLFAEAARDIKAAVRGIAGEATKLIVLDLDDTLWGGIVGDIGWEKIRLGGHDPVGEAFVDFQRALLTLKNRGVLLAIVSKNDEAVALEAIRNHPEMVLSETDFAGWRINWHDKARNILDLLAELNLGPQSVLFIDDSKHERSRVREAIPDVLVPQWPEDKMLYASTLRNLTCFDTPSLSAEDRNRTYMYVAQKKRAELKSEAGTLDDWLKSLGTVVTVGRLTEVDLERTAQLLNKTNQMNLATRRLTPTELSRWADEADQFVYTFRVTDKLGDSGLTGILGLARTGDHGQIVDFVLSCRVLGRRIEETMLHVAADVGRSLSLSTIEARFLPTNRNQPCLDFLNRSGLDAIDEGRAFVLDVARGYPLPEGVQLNELSR